MGRLETTLVAVVLAHFAVVLVHSGAHFSLGIIPPVLDSAFILVVIVAGPPIVLLFVRPYRRAALVILAIFVAAALVYGFAGHFISAGPDHVTLNPSDSATVVFVGTAVVLGALETISIAVAIVALRGPRQPSTSAGPG